MKFMDQEEEETKSLDQEEEETKSMDQEEVEMKLVDQEGDAKLKWDQGEEEVTLQKEAATVHDAAER